ncbi:MAG: GNAT family N-acetyltransferase [Candidatus Thorarchaeota archaeon]
MKLKIQNLQEIDLDAHAQLIYSSRQNSPLRRDERSVDSIKKALGDMAKQVDAYVMIVAQEEKTSKLLGQLLVWLDWGEIGVSMPWQPIIHPDNDHESIALALIEHSKTLLQNHSLTRLEIWMELTSKEIDAMSSTYIPWYEKSGFGLKAKEHFMDNQYSALKAIQYSIPSGIEVTPMTNITNNELKGVVLDTFRSGSDKWFSSMTRAQQEGSADLWLKRDETFDKDASILFTEDGKIIGYNVMRNEDESVEVGPIGVLPSHRGKGLGQALLLESVSRLGMKEPKSIWLTVSTENSFAYELYTRLGFVNKYQILIYTWMP